MCQSGTPGADGGVPGSFAGFWGFPESKVTGAVFVVFVKVDAGAVFHAGKIFFGEFAIGGKLGDAEIIGAVVGAVGEALLFQVGDGLRHFGDVLGGAHQSGFLDVEGGSVFEKRLNHISPCIAGRLRPPERNCE